MAVVVAVVVVVVAVVVVVVAVVVVEEGVGGGGRGGGGAAAAAAVAAAAAAVVVAAVVVRLEGCKDNGSGDGGEYGRDDIREKGLGMSNCQHNQPWEKVSGEIRRKEGGVENNSGFGGCFIEGVSILGFSLHTPGTRKRHC